MIFKAKEMPVNQIDAQMTIVQYSSVDHSKKFNVVKGVLSGKHGLTINNRSDRAYYILNGNGKVTVGEEIFDVGKDDLVIIPSGFAHGLVGDLEFLIITAPAFDPADEESI
ncbi:cupin domain-containing protein [Candidatus Leptofilum sp.]|uniref:cupin domain-containing protein n=1 Tax=Candidatus Leptofilum sp. TaxID=3241576 RepID=UPI003B5B51B2